jgi:hypothetical protein
MEYQITANDYIFILDSGKGDSGGPGKGSTKNVHL